MWQKGRLSVESNGRHLGFEEPSGVSISRARAVRLNSLRRFGQRPIVDLSQSSSRLMDLGSH